MPKTCCSCRGVGDGYYLQSDDTCMCGGTYPNGWAPILAVQALALCGMIFSVAALADCSFLELDHRLFFPEDMDENLPLEVTQTQFVGLFTWKKLDGSCYWYNYGSDMEGQVATFHDILGTDMEKAFFFAAASASLSFVYFIYLISFTCSAQVRGVRYFNALFLSVVLTVLQGLTCLAFDSSFCYDYGCTFSRSAGLSVVSIIFFFSSGLCFFFTTDYPGSEWNNKKPVLVPMRTKIAPDEPKDKSVPEADQMERGILGDLNNEGTPDIEEVMPDFEDEFIEEEVIDDVEEEVVGEGGEEVPKANEETEEKEVAVDATGDEKVLETVNETNQNGDEAEQVARSMEESNDNTETAGDAAPTAVTSPEVAAAASPDPESGNGDNTEAIAADPPASPKPQAGGSEEAVEAVEVTLDQSNEKTEAAAVDPPVSPKPQAGGSEEAVEAVEVTLDESNENTETANDAAATTAEAAAATTAEAAAATTAEAAAATTAEAAAATTAEAATATTPDPESGTGDNTETTTADASPSPEPEAGGGEPAAESVEVTLDQSNENTEASNVEVAASPDPEAGAGESDPAPAASDGNDGSNETAAEAAPAASPEAAAEAVEVTPEEPQT